MSRNRQQYNAGDRHKVGQAMQDTRNSREQLLKDYREVLQLPAGRRLLWHFLEQANLYQNAFTGNSETYYWLGVQGYGQSRLAEMLEADPKVYAEMMLEHADQPADKGNTDGAEGDDDAD